MSKDTKNGRKSPPNSNGKQDYGLKRPTLWKFLKEELSGDNTAYEQIIPEQKIQLVYNFIQVPIALEQVIFFGYWLCLDAYLFLFSFLPIRVFQFFFLLCIRSVSSSVHITRAHMFDVLQAVILICSVVLLLQVDTSQLYHWIRQQQYFKLYLIMNIIEVTLNL
jgi:hypothetical protein